MFLIWSDKNASTNAEMLSAAKNSQWERVSYLMSVNHQALGYSRDKGKTVVHYAAMDNVAEIIAEAKNIRDFLNAKDDEGMTPVHYSINYGQYQAFSALLSKFDNGFPIAHPEKGDIISFPIKKWNRNNPDSQKILKEALLFVKEKGQLLDVPDNQGDYPLHIAVKHNKTEVLELLVLQGCDKSLTNKEGETAYDILKKNQENNAKSSLDLINPRVSQGDSLACFTP